MKNICRLLSVFAFAFVTMAVDCEDWDYENTYVMSEDKVPQAPYLTTVSSDYFMQHIAGKGWKWASSYRIGDDGVGVPYYAKSPTDYTPHDLFFGTDSMTVFLYKPTVNERLSDDYVYDASDNRVVSNAVVYMQLTSADTLSVTFIERIGDHFYENHYERMLPYELNARWNGSTPADQ